MADFADQWNPVNAALADGSFDPQGANNSYAFAGEGQGFQAPSLQSGGNNSSLSWNNLQLPSLTGIDPNSFTGASSGSVSGGSQGVSATNAPSYALGTPSNAAAGAQPQPSSGVVSGSVADYFYRTVIIILGFVFVAVGLNMFKPGIVPNPVNALRR